jgi:hypothetical protein
MPPRACWVTVTDSRGVRHAVEVIAESIYEAAVLALAAFRADDWIESAGPGTQLDVEGEAAGGSPLHHGHPDPTMARWLSKQPRRATTNPKAQDPLYALKPSNAYQSGA